MYLAVFLASWFDKSGIKIPNHKILNKYTSFLRVGISNIVPLQLCRVILAIKIFKNTFLYERVKEKCWNFFLWIGFIYVHHLSQFWIIWLNAHWARIFWSFWTKRLPAPLWVEAGTRNSAQNIFSCGSTFWHANDPNRLRSCFGYLI